MVNQGLPGGQQVDEAVGIFLEYRARRVRLVLGFAGWKPLSSDIATMTESE
jgi:hypothetical protein